jgi:hypothetical protein
MKTKTSWLALLVFGWTLAAMGCRDAAPPRQDAAKQSTASENAPSLTVRKAGGTQQDY